MDSLNLEAKIKERKSKVTQQFKEIEELERQLIENYQNSVRSVYDGLKLNMEKQGFELVKGYDNTLHKILKFNRRTAEKVAKSNESNQKMVWKRAVPISLVLGMILGGSSVIATMHYFPQQKNELHLYTDWVKKVGDQGELYIPVMALQKQTPHIKIKYYIKKKEEN